MDYFLQGPYWADVQRALGRTVHEQTGDGWRFLAVEESNPAGKLLYVPYGPLADSLTAFDAALETLTGLARSCGAVFVRVEPVCAGFDRSDADTVLRSRGLLPAPANLQPELSWVVDLDREFKDVLADMKPVNRNLYRNIHKKGVTFRSSQDPAAPLSSSSRNWKASRSRRPWPTTRRTPAPTPTPRWTTRTASSARAFRCSSP
jgi:hypothetical protein